MKLQIHPSKGIGDLRFGMTFQDAVLVAAQYGEPGVRAGAPARPGQPASPARSPAAHVDFGGFGLRLGAEDWVHLTRLEVRGPEQGVDRGGAEVVFDYEGVDVFGTPVRELAAGLRSRGRNVLWEEEAATVLGTTAGPVFLVPEETFLVSRETSRDMEPDPRDGLPLYPTRILVAPRNYHARAGAWRRGEALYSEQE